MGKASKIEWTDHTQNFWVGCTKISPACDFCYAESWAKRAGHPELWQGERRMTKTWAEPFKWNRAAGVAGTRPKVFTNSLADFFDNQVDLEWRVAAWDVIWRTPNLDWLILTKRPQNILDMLPCGPEEFGQRWENVWLGTTAEDAERYRQRWPHLAAIPARVRFISYEPALGPLGELVIGGARPDWLICGGESGGHARPMNPAWARSLRDQCQAAGVPFFFKQWGEHAPNWLTDDAGQQIPGSEWIDRMGKKAAGRLLDGRTHDEFPAAQNA